MFRSPIAEAIAAKIVAKENVMSAGTYTGAPDEPEGQVIRDLTIFNQIIPITFMVDNGYKGFGEYKTKRVTEEMINWADVVVDMSEPKYDLAIVKNSEKTIFWDVENPMFQDHTPQSGRKKTEEIYKILEGKIKALINV